MHPLTALQDAFYFHIVDYVLENYLEVGIVAVLVGGFCFRCALLRLRARRMERWKKQKH